MSAVKSAWAASEANRAGSSPGPTRTTVHGPGSSGWPSSSVMTTRTWGRLAKSAAIDRRIARPSAAHEAGRGEPASPPPVTHSWTRT